MTEPLPETPPRRWLRKTLHWIGVAITLAFILAGVAFWAIDTTPGHRFLADRIAALRPSSGLRIRIGRIDGSIWSKMELRDFRLSDDQGLFLEVPELTLDWRPTSWFANRLEIRRLETDLAKLMRLPRLRPGPPRTGPLLPSFDIRLDRLSIHRLQAEPAVTGVRRWARIEGMGDIKRGRALIDLGAGSTAGDKIRIKLNAEPDRDKFALMTHVTAPHDGLIDAVLGWKRPFTFDIDGIGTWRAWKGAARMDMSGRRVIDLALRVNSGRYALAGKLEPSPYLDGKLQRLSAPRIGVAGHATLADRRLTGTLALISPALEVRSAGVIDLAKSGFDHLGVDFALKHPPALFPNTTGQNVRLHILFNGPFATAQFNYALTTPHVAFDQTGFEGVHATGQGHLSASPITVPIRLSANRVTGIGQVAGGILRNLTITGALKVTSKRLTGDPMAFTSDKLRGKLALALDLITGHYDVTVSGSLARYLIPGLGIVDVQTELKVLPGEGGRGTQVAGRGRAWVRRFDNAFLRTLAGGLPQIDTGLMRGPDGILHFVGLKLTAPSIMITGNGLRQRDGTFQFSGSGRQARYGSFRMDMDGDISRPKLDIALERPADALGLAAVRLLLDPTAQGYAWRAQGGSYLGPFQGNGAILLPQGQPATIEVAQLDVTGTHAKGALRSDPGGFSGDLALAGGGVDGTMLFTPVDGNQKIEAHLKLNRAQLAGAADATVRRATIDGSLVLDPDALGVDGQLVAVGVRRSGYGLGRLALKASLKGDRGSIGGVVAGSRGRLFDLKFGAALAPNTVSVTASGTIDRQPVTLSGPAVFTHSENGWRLAHTQLSFAGGGASIGGLFGGAATEVDATLDHMPLSVVDIAFPQLGLGGIATGQFSYRQAKGSAMPTGRADLRIRGLTRSGLVLTSRPVDFGLTALLSEDKAVARAVAMSEGKIIGRAQMRIAPFPSEGTLAQRMANAPIFAQMRYNGPADTLWRLTGSSTIDMSGPVAIGADISGTVHDPVIQGSLSSDGGRLESSVTGTVIEQIKTKGRFAGSKLMIDSFAGVAKGGAVTGHGSFDFAAAHGVGMDLQFQAQGAQILNRDDIAATITGPVSIQSDGSGGTIAGNVKVDKGRFRLGRATVSAIPQLDVTELNRNVQDGEEAAPRRPWLLELKADAPNRLAVSGLGLDSEWRAQLAITGTVDNPAIKGEADLVRGGYQFAGKRFDLDRGTIRFTGDAPPDPALDIQASASVQDLSATIRVTGTGQKPQINFISVPAMPEDELLSRLLFGSSITNLSAPEALQLAAAVASLRSGGGGGLDPINAVRRAVGLDRLRVLPADTTTKQGTSVAAGKYIGRRTYVELVTDGQGYSATNIEFQVTRWLSLLSTISTVGRQSANVRISKDY